MTKRALWALKTLHSGMSNDVTWRRFHVYDENRQLNQIMLCRLDGELDPPYQTTYAAKHLFGIIPVVHSVGWSC